MGKPGPAPLPSHLKLLRGTARPSRTNKSEPKPKAKAPRCPEWLSDEAKAEWRKTVKQLKAMGVLFESDQDLIAAYANALVNYRKATLMVDAEGLLIEGRRDGMVTNPAVRVQRDSAQLIRQLAQEFGLSPSSRTRIGTNGDTNDGLDDLLE